MRFVIVILCSVCGLNAAMYYVATNGVDSNPGSEAEPWLTVTNAAANVSAGDTVIVNQGTYTNRVTLATAGTAESRIVFRGTNSPVVGAFLVNAAYQTIDSFHLDGSGVGNYGSIIAGAGTSHHVWVLNNTFTNMSSNRYCLNFARAGVAPSQNASWMVVSNNTIYFPDGIDARVAFTAFGGTNKFLANTFYGQNCAGEPDTFQVYGRDCIIADNLVKDCGIDGAKGGDFWQVWGFRSWQQYKMPNVSAYNPNDGDSYTINGDTRTWKDTVGDASTQIQIGDGYENVTNMINQFDAYPITDVKRYPLENSSVNGTNCLVVRFASTASGTNLTCSESGAWYLEQTGPPDLNSVEQTVNNIIIERNKMINSFFQLTQIETYENNTNIFGGVTWRNNIFISNRYSGAFGINNAKIYNNTFIKCPAPGTASGTPFSFGSSKGSAYGTEILNNIFFECGTDPSNAGAGWYSPGSGVTNYSAVCDYNFVCGYHGNPKNAYPPDSSARWGSYGWETHGINGSSLKYTNIPLIGPWYSEVLGKGTNLSGSFTDDYYGNTRTQWDIGATGLDSNLIMQLDFSIDVTNGLVADLTGNEHHAWQMDSTNWITITNGPGELIAGRWTYAGYIDTYRMSQYGAITNVGGTDLEFLTNGTITLWVHWNTNYIDGNPQPERGATLLDGGYYWQYITNIIDSSIATNGWQLEYYFPDVEPFPDRVPAFQMYPQADYTDTNNTFAFWTNQTRLQNSWWHIAMTWTGGSEITSYENGQPIVTNTFNHPFLASTGEIPPWICLGAEQHSGTPQWGDDSHPNAGWFQGEMADVRIYNRALSGVEILQLYQGAEVGGGGGESSMRQTHSISGRVTASGRVEFK